MHELSAHACSSIRAFDWGAWSSPVEAAMNYTIPHDTSGGAASANTVMGRSGTTVGPSGSHYIIGPLQKASGPRKKEKTAMSHFWDTHHKVVPFSSCTICQHNVACHACSSICAFDWAASTVEVAMNDTFPHHTSRCAASANTVRGCSGSTVGPSGSHYIIGPLRKASGPRKKEKTAMSHFWDTHHTVFLLSKAPFVAAIQSTTECKWPRFFVSKRTIAAQDRP